MKNHDGEALTKTTGQLTYTVRSTRNALHPHRPVKKLLPLQRILFFFTVMHRNMKLRDHADEEIEDLVMLIGLLAGACNLQCIQRHVLARPSLHFVTFCHVSLVSTSRFATLNVTFYWYRLAMYSTSRFVASIVTFRSIFPRLPGGRRTRRPNYPRSLDVSSTST